MSFTWPTIPFQGPEVTAFAVAYKELAEAVLNQYFDNGGPTGQAGELENPYVEKQVVKELLQEGILYACFIIQQRSGTSGPGTDFVLGNSPVDFSDPNLQPAVLRLLGCKWDEMEEALENNIKCGNKPPEPPTDPNEEKCCTGSPTFGETIKLNTWGAMHSLSPFTNVIVEAMKRYLSCDSTPLTEDFLSESQKQQMRDIAQKHLDRGRQVGYAYYTNRLIPGSDKRIVRPKNDPYAINRFGAASVYTVSFYVNGTTVHKLFGDATVLADANDQVMCIKDDFDFQYGHIADRSTGYAGDPITSYGFGPNMNGGNNTKEQVIQSWGGPPNEFGWHREMITEAALTQCDGGQGRGAPVPINICF
jgi:hypothetical protein